jgi:hypothetical protein
MDASNEEVQWLRAFQLAAEQLLRRFIDKAETVSPELFEHYILIKERPMYLRMKIEEDPFIAALHIILLTLLRN